jgi:small multidrug resistance pump
MPLRRWMRQLLWFAGGFNLAAGAVMLLFYHESYELLGVEKPELVMPLQLVGILVALFGVGYWLVARNPIENRNLLVLGFWSKALGSVLALYTVADGELPLSFVPILFFADIIYLVPFWIIIRHLQRQAREAPSPVTSTRYLPSSSESDFSPPPAPADRRPAEVSSTA